MKKIIPLVLLATLGFTGAAMAEGFNNGTAPQANSGFTGGSQTVITAAQALQMPDDSWVTLQGNIVKQVDENHYVLKDSSGEITVKIKGKLWQGRAVTPADTIQVTGEIDTHRYKPKDVEVKNLQIISTAK